MGGARTTGFGALLRRLREAAGFTQEELAFRAGLAAKGIGAIERGERKRPYPHTVRALADALDLSGADRDAFVDAAPKRVGTALAQTMEHREPPLVLPSPPTPLIGREREVAEVLSLLGVEGARLLTLTGPGGVGKTRLALEVATETAGRFPDGVAFAALAPVADAGLVWSTVARVLGLQEAGDQSARELVRDHLRERRLLLVLDNMEHLLDAAPEVAGLLTVCPRLKVLATSRAPLRVRGESEYPVPPLALPDLARDPDVVDRVTTSPAAELFVERARTASPGFEITGDNAAAVAAICRRLGGLPLALELAAPRARFLGPTEILSRLDRALETGGARDLPERQRTLRATLDWSYDLLSEAEGVLFRLLSVFSGGFTLEAAEAVGEAAGIGADRVFDALGGLVEQSLVTVGGALGGETRYGMLEPVRQYAWELLGGSDEADAVRGAHAGYYLALAEQAGPGLKGQDQGPWLARLEADLGNLRAALRWSLKNGEAEGISRAAWASWQFWWWSGRLKEGRAWMEEALATGGDRLCGLVRARLLFVSGTLSQALADWEPARSRAEEALALFRQLRDEEGTAYSLGTAGVVALGQERLEEGISLLEESVDLNLRVGEKWGASLLLGLTAPATIARGDFARAELQAERALSLAREIGSRDGVYVAFLTLATVAWAGDDHARAGRLLKEGLALSAEVGEESHVAYCLEGLAAVAASENDLERAARLWGSAEALLEKIEVIAYTYAPIRSLYHGRVADALDRPDRQTWARALAEGWEMTPEQAVAYALGEDAAAPAVP